MTPPLFPPRIRSISEALDYLPDWCEITGGLQRDGLRVITGPGGDVFVEAFHVDYPVVGTELLVSLVIRRDLTADRYRFQYRRSSGDLLWRADKHPGHEEAFGGPCHLHIGPETNLLLA